MGDKWHLFTSLVKLNILTTLKTVQNAKSIVYLKHKFQKKNMLNIAFTYLFQCVSKSGTI